MISARSTILLGPCSTKPPPWSLGGGNWVSLQSVEAVSKLLWRSSKLTEGRKSNEVDVVSFTSLGAPFLPPKENREWLLEDEALSIGASAVGRRRAPILVGLAFSLRLEAMTRKQSVTWHNHNVEGIPRGCNVQTIEVCQGWVSGSSGATGYGRARQGNSEFSREGFQPGGRLVFPSGASGDSMLPVHEYCSLSHATRPSRTQSYNESGRS